MIDGIRHRYAAVASCLFPFLGMYDPPKMRT
jgi:hypothetical protein